MFNLHWILPIRGGLRCLPLNFNMLATMWGGFMQPVTYKINEGNFTKNIKHQAACFGWETQMLLGPLFEFFWS